MLLNAFWKKMYIDQILQSLEVRLDAIPLWILSCYPKMKLFLTEEILFRGYP